MNNTTEQYHKTFFYELCDDGGSNRIELPIILPIGAKFYHEYGTYLVEEEKDNVILCWRISVKNTL